MATSYKVEQGYPAVSHEARILAMDADGNYTSAEVDYIVKFRKDVVGWEKQTGQDIDAENLEELALVAVRPVAKAKKIGALVLKSVAIKERPAPCAFVVAAAYSKNENGDDDDGGGGGGGGQADSVPQMSYECSAQMKHVTVANRQEIVWTKDATAYPIGNFNGPIGWNGKFGDDLEIAGCDTPTGTATETWTKSMSYSSITTSKKIKWGSMVGKVNKNEWRGWPPRCAMFMGATFQKESGSSRVLVSFHFSVGGPNETVRIEGTNETLTKSPFDYVWSITETDSKNRPVTKAVVVSRVSEEANFSELGI